MVLRLKSTPMTRVLGVIEIGDTIRIEGDVHNEGNTIFIIAVTIIIVDVDVFIK